VAGAQPRRRRGLGQLVGAPRHRREGSSDVGPDRRRQEPGHRPRAAGRRSRHDPDHGRDRDQHLPLLRREARKRDAVAMAVPSIGRPRVALAAVVVGAAGVCLGVFLPWLSFYAGLVPMNGAIGLYGRLLAAGGFVCAGGAAWAWLRPARGVALAVALIGGGLVAFAVWLIVQAFATLHALQSNPMIVPQIGPGLFVALAGSVMAATGATLAARATPSSPPASPPSPGRCTFPDPP